MKSLIPILLLLASACGNPDAFDVEPDLSADFDRAAAEWCGKSGCCPYQGDGPSRVVVSTQDALTRACGVKCRGAAVHRGEATTVMVLEGMPADTTLTVLLHELGHHCGCEHSDDPADVMHLSSEAVELTERDAECAR